MPPPPTSSSRGIMFSSCTAGSCPSTPVLRDAVSLFLEDFNETCHIYSSCEWALLKRFSKSEVKVMYTNVQMLYNGEGVHFDGVASRLTNSVNEPRGNCRY